MIRGPEYTVLWYTVSVMSFNHTTVMLMKSILNSLRMSSLLLFSFGALLNPLLGQSEISLRADEEEMSVRTWRALGPTLNASVRKSSTVNILPLLSEEYKISENTIRRFLIYTLNYTRNELEWPHW